MADMNIHSIGRVAASLKTLKSEPSQNAVQENAFGQWLSKSIQNVSKMHEEADTSVLKLASGENKDIHGTMIKMQKAEIATNLMVAVRNKVISAYDEIKRMQF